MGDVVSFVVQTRSLQRYINELQTNMVDRGNEVTTGKKENLTEEIGGEIRNYLDLHNARNELIKRKERLQTADNRLAQIGISFEILQQQSNEFVDLFPKIGIVDRTTIDVYINQADSTLSQVKTALNSKWGGRYLLSGDAVLDPPISGFDTLKTAVENVMATHATAAGGVLTTTAEIDAMITEIETIFDNTHATSTFDSLAYSGGTGDMAGIEIAESDIMGYNAKANDSEIRELAKGMIMLSTADTFRTYLENPSSREASEVENHYLEQTTATIMNAGNLMIEKRSSIGFKEQRVNDTLEGIESINHQYEQRIGFFENADPYEAGIAFSELQRQLEASFYVSAEIKKLSILNYL